MVNKYQTPEQAEAASPYAGNTGVVGQTAAQADAQNIIGRQNRANVGLGGGYGGRTSEQLDAINYQTQQDNQRRQQQRDQQQQQQQQGSGQQMKYMGWEQDQRETQSERTYLESLDQRPGYYAQSQIGDTETQRRVAAGESMGSVLESQRKAAALTPGTRDDQYFLNELSKWNRTGIETSSEYHAETKATGLQQKANKYENWGDVALAIEKGGNQKDFTVDKYGFNPNVGGALGYTKPMKYQGWEGEADLGQQQTRQVGGVLPGGKGLQETAWEVAKSGKAANVDFQPAVDYLNYQKDRMGPYGNLYGGVPDTTSNMPPGGGTPGGAAAVYDESGAKRPFVSANAPRGETPPTGKDWNPFVASAAEPTGYISEGAQLGKTETSLPSFEDFYQQKAKGLETNLAAYNILKTDYETGLAKYKEGGSSDPVMYQHLTEEQTKLDTMYGGLSKQSEEVSTIASLRGMVGFNNDILKQQLGQEQKPEEPRALSFGGLVSDFTKSFEKLKSGDVLGGIGLYSQGISRYSTRAVMPDATGFGAYVDKEQATAPTPVGSVVAGGAYFAETVYTDIRKDPVQDVALYLLPGAFKYGENLVARGIARGAESQLPLVGTLGKAASRVGPTDFGQYIIKGALVLPWIYESGKSIYEAPMTPEGKGTAIGHVGYQVGMMWGGQKGIADQMILASPKNEYKGYSLITGKRAEGPITFVKNEALMFAGTTELRLRGLPQEAEYLKLTWAGSKLSRFIEPPVTNEANILKDIVEVPAEQIDPLTKVFANEPGVAFGSGPTYGQFTETGKYPETRLWDLELMKTEGYRNAPDMKTRFAMQDAARPDIVVPEGYVVRDYQSPKQKMWEDVLTVMDSMKKGEGESLHAYEYQTGIKIASATSSNNAAVSENMIKDTMKYTIENTPAESTYVMAHTHPKTAFWQEPDFESGSLGGFGGNLKSAVKLYREGDISLKQLVTFPGRNVKQSLYERAAISTPSEVDITGLRDSASMLGVEYEMVISKNKAIVYPTEATEGTEPEGIFSLFGKKTEAGIQNSGTYRAWSRYQDTISPGEGLPPITKNPKAYIESTYESKFVEAGKELGFEVEIFPRSEVVKLAKGPQISQETPTPQYQVAKGMDFDYHGDQIAIDTKLIKIKGSMVQVTAPAEGNLPKRVFYITGEQTLRNLDAGMPFEHIGAKYVNGVKIPTDISSIPDKWPLMPGEKPGTRVVGKYTPEDWKTPIVWRIFGSPFDSVPLTADLNVKGTRDFKGDIPYTKANYQTRATGDAISKDVMSLTERMEGDQQFRGYRFEKEVYHDISTKQQLYAADRARLAAGEKATLTAKQLDKADLIIKKSMQIEVRYQPAKGEPVSVGKIGDIMEIGKERMDVGLSLKGEALPPIRAGIGEPKFLKDYPVPEKNNPMEMGRVIESKSPPKPKGGGLTPEEAIAKYGVKTKTPEEIAAKYLGRSEPTGTNIRYEAEAQQPPLSGWGDASTGSVKRPNLGYSSEPFAQPSTVQPSTIKNIPGEVGFWSTSQPLSEELIVAKLAQQTKYGAGVWEHSDMIGGMSGKMTRSPQWDVLMNVGKKYGYSISEPRPVLNKQGGVISYESIVQKGNLPQTTQISGSLPKPPKQSFVPDMRDTLPESQEPFYHTEVNVKSPAPSSKPLIRGIVPMSMPAVDKAASMIATTPNTIPSMKGGYGKADYPKGLPTQPYSTPKPDFGILPYDPNKVTYTPPPTYTEKPVYTPGKPLYTEKPIYNPPPPYTEKPPYNKPPYVEPPYNPYPTGYPEKPGYPAVPGAPFLPGGSGGYPTKRRGRKFTELFPLGLDLQVYNYNKQKKPHARPKKGRLIPAKRAKKK